MATDDPTELVITQMPSGERGTPATITWGTADVDGNYYYGSGREILLIRNANPTDSHSVTISATALPVTGREDDLIISAPGASEIVLPMIGIAGWLQDDGSVQVQADSIELSLAVIRLPF